MIERSGEVASDPVRTTIVHGRWTGYRRLLQARLKELFRAPEVIFWIFLFPAIRRAARGLSSPASLARSALPHSCARRPPCRR